MYRSTLKQNVQYIYVESGGTFTLIKQTSTGFNDRTGNYKEEFVPPLQPAIIHDKVDQ